MNGNGTNGQADRFFDAAANLMNAAAFAARGPSVLVLDTTGTGIPTVETHDGDSPNWQTMCRTAMAQADAYRDLVEDWKRLYHATKAERDALLAACRACVAGESGWGTRMDAAIAKIGGAA